MARRADISLRTEPAREIVRFSSDASIGFPGTDLSALSVARTDSMYCKPGSRFFRQPVAATGLLSGSDGAGVCTERRRPERISRSIQPPLDTVCLSCRRKYRYYICFRNGGTDTFHSACTHWSGWVIRACVTGLPLTTAKCWPTPEFWQHRPRAGGYL